MEEEPKLVRRRANRHSAIKAGRTIGERREKLETSNERMAARKKDKRKKSFRVFFVSVIFLLVAAILITLYFAFFSTKNNQAIDITAYTYEPTIEIIDEDQNAAREGIPTRMRSYIGQAESDFRARGLTPVKAVIPASAIREIDFYLEGHSGFVKMTIDRDTAVSVEDADRMFRYLSDSGITDFQYIDVRLPGKAYWK